MLSSESPSFSHSRIEFASAGNRLQIHNDVFCRLSPGLFSAAILYFSFGVC